MVEPRQEIPKQSIVFPDCLRQCTSFPVRKIQGPC